MLFKSALALLAATAAVAAPAPLEAAADSAVELVERQFSACATGVHIIVARASTEPQGEGIIGAVATAVKQRIPGSDSEAVVYPATLSSYTTSQAAGVQAMNTLVNNYAARCPNSKIVLMGYSQGAHVLGDVLVGPSSFFGGSTGTSVQNIIAAVQMGDPSHVSSLPGVNVGTSMRNGIFPRRNAAGLANFATKSYCDFGDNFCDGGYLSSVHLSYVRKYGTQAADHVVQRYQAAA